MTGSDPLAFDVVDVFADGPFAGNQLAVVHGSDGLSTAQLQRLASEFGFAETTFPTAARPDGYDVRIFTPGSELPFAGHPTLGTAWLLREQGRVGDGPLVQRCAAGEYPVRFLDGLVELTATPGVIEGPVPDDVVDRLLAAVGLTPADRAGDAWVAGTGIEWTHLPVVPSAIARARVPSALASEAFAGWPGRVPLGVALAAVDDSPAPAGADLALRCRVFSMDGDVGEDPATGSAAAALGVALPARGLLADGGVVTFTQGVEMGRPSRLRVSITAADGVASEVRVAGAVHHVASGTIAVPPA